MAISPEHHASNADVSPRVLVLLAACNGEKWIGEQIQSILRQNCAQVHVVVRDDASSDGTIAEVKRICDIDGRVELQVSASPSGSASQNFFTLIRSVDATGFNFVALSDQDDVWDDNKLQLAIQTLTTTRSAGYSSAVTAVWPGGKSRVLRQSNAVTQYDYLFEGAGQGCTFVLPAFVYGQVRTFLGRYESLTRTIHYHDWTIYALLRSWGLDWTFYPNSTMRYRQHDTNDTGARSTVGGIQIRLRRVRRGWYAQQLLEIAQLCHAAAPANATVSSWYRALIRKRDWRRRIVIAQACLRGGRRRSLDTALLVLFAVLGWL